MSARRSLSASHFADCGRLGWSNKKPAKAFSDQKWGGFWHYWAGFLQDQWKINPRLTLTFGVRWEYTRPRTEKWNRQSVFSPEAYYLAQKDRINRLLNEVKPQLEQVTCPRFSCHS